MSDFKAEMHQIHPAGVAYSAPRPPPIAGFKETYF